MLNLEERNRHKKEKKFKQKSYMSKDRIGKRNEMKKEKWQR